MSISYDVAETELGMMLMAATERGVCFLAFGDDAAALEAQLRAAFPRDDVRRDTARLAAWMAAVAESLKRNTPPPDLPLDTGGTPFQRRVWDALREIPRGETRTYGELAASLGMPSAARAVGAACGANRISLLIPCHRAVGAGGRLTGYRWGLPRKSILLEMEAQP